MNQNSPPLTSREKEVDRWFQYALESMKMAKEYGLYTIQSLVILNGGALIAILALLGNLDAEKLRLIAEHGSIDNAILAFCFGVVFAAAAAGFGYINYAHLHLFYPAPHELSNYQDTGVTTGWRRERMIVVGWTNTAGVASVLLSLAMLLTGSIVAKNAIMQALRT